jgi:hypothetical protein
MDRFRSHLPFLPRAPPAGAPRHSGSLHGPFPFRQPVSTAAATALVIHHASAALWAGQINDRGDEAGFSVPQYPVDDPHSCSHVAVSFFLETTFDCQGREVQPESAYVG